MGTERHDPTETTVGMASETVPHAHESGDVNVRAVVVATMGLALVTLGALALIWVQIHQMWSARRATLPPPSPVAGVLPSVPPEPRLQTSPAEDLQALRTAEERQLHTYGWVDRDAGVVRIPIERAIELVVKEAGR